jgi:hypothetical protein
MGLKFPIFRLFDLMMHQYHKWGISNSVKIKTRMQAIIMWELCKSKIE